MTRRLHLTLALLGLLAGPAAAGVGCRDFPMPDRSRVVIVAEDMVVNNVPMAVRELHSRQAPDEIIAFYRMRWEAQGQKTLLTDSDGWRTLATRDGDCFYTAQTRTAADGGTYALLGVTRSTGQAGPAPGTGFPMMGGSRVFNDLKHKDGPKNARTVLLTNTYSPDANANFYRNAFAAQGWQSMLDRKVDTPRGPSVVQVWKRATEETSLTIAGTAGMTQVVANVVDRP